MGRTPFLDPPRGSRPPAGFHGRQDLARAKWNPGGKRSGRQAVLAARRYSPPRRIAPPRQDWRTPLQSQPGGCRNLFHPHGTNPWGFRVQQDPALGSAPFIPPWKPARMGDNASYPTGKQTAKTPEASPPPPMRGTTPLYGGRAHPNSGVGRTDEIFPLPWSAPEPWAGELRPQSWAEGTT